MARFLLDTPLADFSAKKRLHMKNLQYLKTLSTVSEFLKSSRLQLTETCGLKLLNTGNAHREIT